MKEETIIRHLEEYGNCFLGKKTISKCRIDKVIKELSKKQLNCTYKEALNFPKCFVIERVKAPDNAK